MAKSQWTPQYYIHVIVEHESAAITTLDVRSRLQRYFCMLPPQHQYQCVYSET